MKKLVVLGSGGAWPDGDRNPPSMAIFADSGETLLVDCGPGAVSALVRAGSHPRDISAIALTHTHIDHCSDLAPILFGAFLTGREHPMPVYGPKGTHALVSSLFDSTYPFAQAMMVKLRSRSVDVQVHELDDREETDIGPFTVRAYAVKHGIETFGYRVSMGDRSIGISGDTEPCDALVELAKGVDLLVQDCAWPDDVGPKPGHCIPTQIGPIAAAAAARQVVLYHMFPPCNGREDDLVAGVKCAFDGPVEVAHDLSQYML